MKNVRKMAVSYAVILFECTVLAMFLAVGAPAHAQDSESVVSPPAQEVPVQSGAAITVFKVDGLKKTRDSYVQHVLKKYSGVLEDELDLHVIETELQKEGLFSFINVALEHDESDAPFVHITVKEKWTFIPVPFFMVSNGSVMGGGVVMDTNAFGIKDSVMVGGIFSKESLMGMAAFSTPTLEHKPGISFFGSFTHGTGKTIRNLDDDDVFLYDINNVNVSVSMNCKFNHVFSGSIGAGYVYKDIGSEAPSLDSYHAGNIQAGLSFKVSDWNGYFMSGISCAVNGKATYKSTNEFSETISFSIDWQKPIVPRFRVFAHGATWYGHNLDQTEYQGAYGVGIGILPSKFYSPWLAGMTAGGEWVIVKMKLGIISMYAQYEAVFARDYEKSVEFCHGPLGGVKLYLSSIAFPALGFAIGYNIPKEQLQFTFSFGMSL